jgi:hypothetical protein
MGDDMKLQNPSFDMSDQVQIDRWWQSPEPVPSGLSSNKSILACWFLEIVVVFFRV